MTELDVADLVVIAAQVLGIDDAAALAHLDIAAAQAALTEARLVSQESSRALPDRAAAAAAGARLVHALLRHRPFPHHSAQVAVAAGLQYLSLNGWQAGLNPPGAAAVVVEGLASGQLTPANAAAWLLPRLSPYSPPTRRDRPMRTVLRGLGSVLPLHGPGAAGMVVDGRMLARFTDHAAASIFLAQQEARRLGHAHIDPEHLLLGLIAESEGTAVKALTRIGISLELLRQQIEDSIGHGQETPPGPIRPSRPRGQKVLNSALPEALAHGHTDQHGCPRMGTEHLLLAQFHDDGAAAQTLTRLGAAENEVRSTIAAMAAQLTASPAQRHGTRKRAEQAGETERLRHEITRLRELLLQHGIAPEGSQKSA